MGLKSNRGGKLVYSKLLDDFQNIHLLTQLALGVFEEEVLMLLLGLAAEAILLVELHEAPPAFELVREGFTTLNLISDLFLFF